MNLDGWTFAGLDHRTAAQPVMILYEDPVMRLRRELAHAAAPPEDPDAQMEFADTRIVQANLQANLELDGGWRLGVTGARHLDFSDQPLLPALRREGLTGTIAPAEVERLDREVVRAFFEQSLSGRRSALLMSPELLHRAFPEIEAVHYEPAPK